MATDTRISGLPAIPSVVAADKIEVLDVSNTTNQATGENTVATMTQVAAAIAAINGSGGGSPFVGAGTGHAAGQVPDPGATAHATPYILGDDGSFHPLGGTALSYAGGTYTFTAGTGGAATPGGTPGQVQVNSAGAFGGADLTTLLDTLTGSPAQGSVFFRGSAAWNDLAPGTSGLFLKTQGAGADPVWATPAGGGSSNTITLFSAKNLTAVANSTSLLSLLTGGTVFTGTQAAGGFTFLSSLLASGARIVIDVYGIFSATGPTISLKWVFTLNGVTVLQSAASNTTAAVTNGSWLSYTKTPTIWLPTVSGAASLAEGFGLIETVNASTLAYFMDVAGLGASLSATTPATVDLSPTNVTMDFKAQWGVAAPGNTVQVKGIDIKLMLPS